MLLRDPHSRGRGGAAQDTVSAEMPDGTSSTKPHGSRAPTPTATAGAAHPRAIGAAQCLGAHQLTFFIRTIISDIPALTGLPIRAPKPSLSPCGTGSSNPVPSSGESANGRFLRLNSSQLFRRRTRPAVLPLFLWPIWRRSRHGAGGV